MMQGIEIMDNSICPSPEISAYIDGELSAQDEMRLELHIAGCLICADDLNLQKSFLIALDASLEDEKSIELPAGFAKAVVANAESRVSGLRRPHERRNAAFICVTLIAFSILGLGTNAESSFAAAAPVAEKLVAVVESATHFVYNLAFGSTVVFKSLATKFVFESAVTVSLVLVVFVLSLYIFSRLLTRIHRT
jgi:anti-sigma factor RsiW